MNKYIFLILLIFSITLGGCKKNNNETPSDIVNQTGLIKNEEIKQNKLPINYGLVDDYISPKLINKDIYDNILSGKHFGNYEKINKNCYHLVVSLSDQYNIKDMGDIRKVFCLSDIINSGENFSRSRPIYYIETGYSYGSQISKDNTGLLYNNTDYFDTLKFNNSNLLNQYINSIYLKNKFIIYNNASQVISTVQYKSGVLAMVLVNNQFIGFKYLIFDGKQYDFDLNASVHDDLGSILIPSINDSGYSECRNKYNDFILSNNCRGMLISLFNGKIKNQEFENYLNDTKKIIDKIIK